MGLGLCLMWHLIVDECVCVECALFLVGLAGLGGRKFAALSGG